MKKKVGILLGGKSVEHEVSIITGLQVFDNIDISLYNPLVIYINQSGKWYVGDSLSDISFYKNINYKNIREVVPYGENNKLVLIDKKSINKRVGRKYKDIVIDIVIPAVHGTNCEDGSIHGFCQMYDIPCAFGSVLSSSVGMDKIIMKKLFSSDGLPIVPYFWFYKYEVQNDYDCVVEQAHELGYPIIVKPANLGSSIGINKVNNADELVFALDVALSYDNKVIIEKCIENVREINCAVLGYEDDIISSYCEEPLGWKEFLSFDDKYIHKEKFQDETKRKMPADLDLDISNKIQSFAKQAFKSVDCSGNARIDFLYDGDNIYINEINTIPGSLAFYMWEYSNISFRDLINKIIDIAEEKNSEKLSNIIRYDVDLLNNLSKRGKCK